MSPTIHTSDEFFKAFGQARYFESRDVTASKIFKCMEDNLNDLRQAVGYQEQFVQMDFVRDQIQAAINEDRLCIKYGVFNQDGGILSSFNALADECETLRCLGVKKSDVKVEAIFYTPDQPI